MSWTYAARFALVLDSFLRVGLRSLDVVDRLLHVVLNPIDHLALETTNTLINGYAMSRHLVDVTMTRTCDSTNMAMSMNMSCSSLMLFSSFMMSLCLASMSFSDCRACVESVRIWDGKTSACHVSNTVSRHVGVDDSR